jgi:hypothetical protein
MAVKIEFIPSMCSEVQGISAVFDGHYVSYSGDYFSAETKTIEHSAYDGYGVTFDNDFEWSGVIKVGNEVFCGKKKKIVKAVRVRVTSQEATWDEAGFTVSIPEITFDGKTWQQGYGCIPVKMKSAMNQFLRRRAKEDIKTITQERIRNGYKSSQHEIIAECKTWASEYLSSEEAIKIGLEVLRSYQ